VEGDALTTLPYALYQLSELEQTYTVDSILEHVGMECTYVLQYLVDDEWVTEVFVDQHWTALRRFISMALSVSESVILVHQIGGTVINCVSDPAALEDGGEEPEVSG
jgi:hypothetical protein